MINVSAIEDEPLEDEPLEHMESISEPEAPKVELKVKRVRKKSEIQTPPPPPSPEPVTAPTRQQPKMGRMTTCTNCGKELLEKTFRYYHQLKCKPKEPTPIEQHNKAEQRPASITVDFNFRNRSDMKQSKYANLFTKAF
jgi:hypothetical protein